MSRKSPIVIALTLAAACCGPAATGAVAAGSGAGANGSPGSGGQQSGQPQGDYSAIERDPFRACVAAHPDDPNRQQNCGWEGTYTKSR